MKTRFTTVDLISALHGIRKIIGMRVVNVYDIDNKTYLLKLAKPDSKAVILIESGSRIHTTDFDYAKNLIPSGFSMKLRKHVRQKRLESVTQLGVDRIVDLQFGSGEVACHFIVELYDRGNLILTDFDYVILNVLRPRTDKENTDVRFAVREKYPLHLARQPEPLKPESDVRKILENAANPNDNLRKILTAQFPFGAALIEHSLLNVGLSPNIQINKILKSPEDFGKIYDVLVLSNEIFEKIKTDPEFPIGVITLKQEKQASGETFESYTEFHPMLYKQHDKENFYKKYDSFNVAVDEFFSRIESQKIEAKSMQKEKTALKKLENIQRDHETRLKNLQSNQNVDKRKAELIELNKELVDRAILIVNSALANQLSWEEIQESIDEAKQLGDKTARAFKSLKLDVNHISLRLTDPFLSESADETDDEEEKDERSGDSVILDIDLGLGAFQNARKYYTQKKQSAIKENKTIAASEKALKSAEAKTQDLLKQVQLIRNITKTRKTYWFEKFFWFISSDGYLVIGGRDAQQNELIVKRYLKPGDAYVHADIKGASSVVVKNRVKDATADLIPPKTLSEAGTMAVCYSAAWEAKVVTSAWWVNAEQVSKTAPTGLYLGTGSFMIRGKKNFLPPCQLIMGFGIMFKLDDESTKEHAKLRKNEQLLTSDENYNNNEDNVEAENEDAELKLDDGSDNISDEEGLDSNQFPDVAVTFRHLSVDSESSQQKLDDEEYSVIQIGPRVVNVRNKSGAAADKSGGAKKGGRNQQQKDGDVEKSGVVGGKQEKAQQKLKRGQRAKLKKIKEKYKDQDEEERDLRLRLLGSAGPLTKIDVKKEQSGDNQRGRQVRGTVNTGGSPVADPETISPIDEKPEDGLESNKPEEKDPFEGDQQAANEVGDGDLEEADADPDPEPDQDELSKFNDESTAALDSISGVVLEKDLLLFALTTCAPYSAMNNFKFKVKLTPGTGKKGKATKTALQVFLKDKILNQREKELIKSLNDQDLSRNFPGKVKLSAPQLQAVKKKH